MDAPTVAVAMCEDRAIHPFDLYELGIITSIFGVPRPELHDPWYRLRLCAVQPGTEGSVPGFALSTSHGLDELITADTVIVPSVPEACVAGEAEVPGELLEALREAAATGARVVSLCAGAYALAAAGLLDGRRATVNHGHSADVARRFPRVHIDDAVLYVDDGDVLTSAGMSAGIDLCLHLVRNDFGAQVANALARSMVVPAHRPGGQAQFVDIAVPDSDDVSIAPVLEWARGHLDAPLEVSDLAARAQLSQRSFFRQLHAATGTTPMRWLLQQRLSHARHLLESTRLSMDQIARRCGLGASANLRRHFAARLGVSPGEYRRNFHAARG